MRYVEWLIAIDGVSVDVGETSFARLFFLAKCQAKSKNII
jgi:hypothetical protein